MRLDIKEDKIQSIVVKVFFVLCFFTTGIMFLNGILSSRSPIFMTVVSFIMQLVCLFAIYYLLDQKKVITKKFFYLSVAILFSLLIVMQTISAYFLIVDATWDMGGVYISAREFVMRGKIITHEHYFDRFPNNNGILAIEIVYFKILRLFGVNIQIHHAIILNVFCIDLGIFFMTLFVKNTKNIKSAMFFLVFSVLFTPYILYAPIFYTDTISIPFITFSLLLLSKMLVAKTGQSKILYLILISLFLAMGSQVKATVSIILVAIIIWVLFQFRIKAIAITLVLLLLPFGVFTSGFNFAIEKSGIITKESDLYKFPMEHWVYMGLKNPGGFDQEDFEYIYRQENLNLKKAAAQKGIQTRIHNYDAFGMLDHLRQKSAFTYNDGAYFSPTLLQRVPLKQNSLQQFIFKDGKYHFLYFSISNAFHFLMLLLICVGMILGIKKKKIDITTMFYIALFGLSIFLMIWETRSRYILNFTPITLYLASNTLSAICDAIKVKIHSRKAIRAYIDNNGVTYVIPPNSGNNPKL